MGGLSYCGSERGVYRNWRGEIGRRKDLKSEIIHALLYDDNGKGYDDNGKGYDIRKGINIDRRSQVEKIECVHVAYLGCIAAIL